MKKIFTVILLSFAALSVQALDIASFGGICDATTDNTPPLNAAIVAAANSNDKLIYFPAGNCRFFSQPNPLVNGVSVIGQGKSTTVLQRAYSGSFFKLLGNGVRLENFTLYAESGTSGGIGIEMLASDVLGVGGNHIVQGVWITGEGTWTIPLGAWGHERTIAPVGIRTITLRDVSVFNSTWQAVTWWGCVSCEWFGGGAYQGYGTTQAIVVGGTNAVKNRIDANIDWASSTVYSGTMR